MVVRTFKGISSLQEVECSGRYLQPEVKVFSLKLFRVSDQSVVAHVNPITNKCTSFGEFSSCFVDAADTHRSLVRTLVADLEYNESREYGCTVKAFGALGDTQTFDWVVAARTPSMYLICWQQFFFNRVSLHNILQCIAGCVIKQVREKQGELERASNLMFSRFSRFFQSFSLSLSPSR